MTTGYNPTPLKTLTLIPPKAPNLPIGPVQYDQRYQDQFANALRLYFNQIDNFAQPFASNTGTAALKFPNGSWYDTTTQTAAAINTAYAMKLNTSSVENGIANDPTTSSKLVAQVPGYYNIQFSAQVSSASGASQYIWIWPRVNGVDIPDSNTKLAIQGTSAEVVAAWNFVVPLNTGDYFQLMWAVTNTGVKLLKEPATAFGPAIPSVIVTATFVSALY